MTTATIMLYRMALPDHVCPYGLDARRMLVEAGLEFEEHVLATRTEVDAFKAAYDVPATPQLFVDGKRIGGSRELKEFLARQPA